MGRPAKPPRLPGAYRWRRIVTLTALAGGVTVLGAALDSLPIAIALALVYPLALVPLGFYQPTELARLRRLVPGW